MMKAPVRHTEPPPPPPVLPAWASDLVTLYESGAFSQFVLHGNVEDIFFLGGGASSEPGDLETFLNEVLLPPFDVVMVYDLARGIRVIKGEKVFEGWPSRAKYEEGGIRKPAEAIALLDHFLRYVVQLAKVRETPLRVALTIRASPLILPAAAGILHHDLSAMALLVRSWATEPPFLEAGIATFLVAENINDLSTLLANNSRTARIEIPLPAAEEIAGALKRWSSQYPVALGAFKGGEENAAAQLVGATLGAVSALLKRREYEQSPLDAGDLTNLKKELVETECNGLIEFIESDKSLDDIYGQDVVKEWLRQDIALWQQNDLQALPMGYLFCGPVGTGKTYLVRCLAGEAGVPVVKFKNFRDRWVGSTEGNLEKIFRLLHALGRCIVFIDEADQALGRRSGGSGDSGVSGRVYSMMAEEMSQPANRGKILWVLASSRPDLIEVDLKRPGRIDVKIPLFPTATGKESLVLIQALGRKFGVDLEDAESELSPHLTIPEGMTPGAAEALVVKVYRLVKTSDLDPVEALERCLADYQTPVPEDVIQFQIKLAVEEATDLGFVPDKFRV